VPSARPARTHRPRGSMRGSPLFRLRLGFVVIAMVLSVFGARLVQLQGLDPKAYAEMAAAAGTVEAVLPAARGDILDRNGEPLARSVEGVTIIADPELTAGQAPEIAKFLSNRLDVDYFSVLPRLREEGSRFEYVARRVPTTQADKVLAEAAELGYTGLTTSRDPVRDYPAEDVAANMVGFVGTDDPLAGFERTFDEMLAGTDGSARYQVGDGNRIPLGENTVTPPVDGHDLRTTIDLDLQWYVQRVLRQAVEDSGGESGMAVVMDTRTGELLALADHPTFDASDPLVAPKEDLGSRGISDVYEPGSVEKVLTVAGLLDAGKVTPRTRLVVPPELNRDGRVINDWFPHPTLKLTLAGVIAKSSNIGTVRAADEFGPGELRRYLTRFGLGSPTDIGIRGESAGILPAASLWDRLTGDRVAFGQSLSVNAVQMTAAVNTIANGGVRVDPSVISGSATTEDGVEVGTDHTTTRRVVSPRAAEQTMEMMERVVHPEVGTAPAAAVPGYRVAGKTGTAQRVGEDCGCYDGTFTVSFAGFAPADDPRFTVYVVVQDPSNGGGGGSVGGPAFSKIMSYALRRYAVPPTGTRPSQLPIEW
jgi:cell division protein FtsI (penicillin-binding protein 3)